MKTEQDFKNNKEEVSRIDKHLSVCYLLMSIAMQHFDFAEERLNSYSLTMRETKRYLKATNHNFDLFNSELRKRFAVGQAENFSDDYERLSQLVDKFAKINKNDWK